MSALKFMKGKLKYGIMRGYGGMVRGYGESLRMIYKLESLLFIFVIFNLCIVENAKCINSDVTKSRPVAFSIT